MKNWYLIQRCSKRVSPIGNKGVDKILSFDYMGSAEFEFGALGTAIKAFRNLKGEITLTKSAIKTRFNTPIWVVAAKNADLVEIEKRLKVLSVAKMHLKEQAYLDYHFDKSASEYKKDITSWLVLDADPVFFSVDEGMARGMLAELKLETASEAN